MAYTFPNSNIRLYQNMPMTSDYQHTIWFDTQLEQDTWFLNNYKQIYAGTALYYVRPYSGYVQVDPTLNEHDHTAPYNTFAGIKHANYIRIYNSDFDKRPIYGFVTSIEYINNQNVQVNFVVDILQTYMFSCQIYDSFVERMHSQDDVIGENTIEENVEIGDEYLIRQHGVIKRLLPNRVVMLISRQIKTNAMDTSKAPSTVVNGIFGGCTFFCYKVPDGKTSSDSATNNLTDLILQIYDKLNAINDEEILYSIQYPDFLDTLYGYNSTQYYGGNFFSPNDTTILFSKYDKSEEIYVNIDWTNKNFNGYTVKNNKLLSYPYNYLTVTNNEGVTHDLHFELFNNQQAIDRFHFSLHGGILPMPIFNLFPVGYKSDTAVYGLNYEYGLPMTDFPNNPYVIDAYKGYMLSNKGSNTLNVVSGLLDISKGLVGANLTGGLTEIAQSRNNLGQFTGGFSVGGKNNLSLADAKLTQAQNTITALGSSGGIRSGFAKIGSVLAGAVNAEGLPKTVNLSFDQCGLKVPMGKFNYEYFVMTIKPEFAKRIDDYFSMFGYAQKEIMPVVSPSSTDSTVKAHRRQVWNYVKTCDCNVRGIDDISQAYKGIDNNILIGIKDIYDNGVTFWDKDSTVQDYTQDNKLWNEV